MPLCTPTQHNNKGKQTKKRIFQREIAKKSTSQKSRKETIRKIRETILKI
jgi:hypothetical protein